jgi:ribosomal protein L29
MKAKDLRERSTEDLSSLKASLSKDLFSHKMKNFTGQLDDTSLLNKTRRTSRASSSLLERACRKGASRERDEANKRSPVYRRKLIGRVSSDKMDKTVVVEVVRFKRDTMYKKYVASVSATRRTTRRTSTRSATASRSRSIARSRARSASGRHALIERPAQELRRHDPDADPSWTSPTTPAPSASSASRCWAARAVVTPRSATSSSSPSKKLCRAAR